MMDVYVVEGQKDGLVVEQVQQIKSGKALMLAENGYLCNDCIGMWVESVFLKYLKQKISILLN